jgi:hypothetical protein
MARIREIEATATIPAADDYAVIDGATFSVRKIRIGGAATLEFAPVGDAGPVQAVVGSDSRLRAGAQLGTVAVTSPSDGDLLQFDEASASWRNSRKALLTDGGNY